MLFHEFLRKLSVVAAVALEMSVGKVGSQELPI